MSSEAEKMSSGPAPSSGTTSCPKADFEPPDDEGKGVVHGCENKPGSQSCNGEGAGVHGSENKKVKLKSELRSGFVLLLMICFAMSFGLQQYL